MLPLLIRLAALLGRLASALRLRGPSPAEVRRAFLDLPPGEAGRVARDASAARFANAVVRRALRAPGGAARVEALLEVRGEGPLRALLAAGRPVVLATWHAGILNALSVAALRLAGGRPVLLLARGAERAPAGIEVADLLTGSQRAAGLLRAAQHLRGGGVVALAADLWHHRGVPMAGEDPFLGRAVNLMQGPGALARLGRAAIVPLALRREGGRIVADLLPPIEWAERGESNDDGDRGVVARLAAAWEGYFRERPGEMWVERMRALAGAPEIRAGAPEVRAAAASPPPPAS